MHGTLGPKHPATLSVMLLDQGKAGRGQAAAHPNTWDAYTILQSLHTAQGSTREARELQAKHGAAGRK